MSSGEFLVVEDRAVDETTTTVLRREGYRQVGGGDFLPRLYVRDGHDLDLAGCSVEGEGRSGVPGSQVAVIGSTTVADPAERVRRRCSEASHGAEQPLDSSTLVGNFAAAIVDGAGARVVTDHLGVVPLYRTESSRRRGVVVGSHLAHVVEVAARRAIDRVSAAQFVTQSRITFPHTLFAGVERLPPGSVSWVVEGRQTCSTHYWVPNYPPSDDRPTVDEAAQAVRSAMVENLGALARGRSQVHVAMSGGEDSRVVAAELRGCSRVPVEGLIVVDGPNRELRRARQAARVIGIDLQPRWREPDHYTAGLQHALEEIGGGIDLNHDHLRGVLDPSDVDLLVDGWGADAYCKGLRSANEDEVADRELQDHRRRLWRRRSARVPHWAAEVRHELRERNQAHLQRVLGFRDEQDAMAWATLWPASEVSSHAFPVANRRRVPTASPFAFGNVVEAAAQVPDAAKSDGQLMWAAFGRHLGLAGAVPRGSGGMPLAPPAVDAQVRRGHHRLNSASRWMRRQVGRGAGRVEGPWQNPMVKRKAIAAALADLPRDAEREVVVALSDGPVAATYWDPHRMPPTELHRVLQLTVLVRSGHAEL